MNTCIRVSCIRLMYTNMHIHLCGMRPRTFWFCMGHLVQYPLMAPARVHSTSVLLETARLEEASMVVSCIISGADVDVDVDAEVGLAVLVLVSVVITVVQLSPRFLMISILCDAEASVMSNALI